MINIDELEKRLTEPTEQLIENLADIEGNLLILGAGGKMGPSLAVLAKRALSKAGNSSRVIGVSRYSDEKLYYQLKEQGVDTIKADLMDEEAMSRLPDAKYVFFLVGTKFGTSGNECFTWALNSYLPGRVATKYRESSIVVFSTGNVYPFTFVEKGGATEDDPTGPVGEYAQSCLGRERIFEYFSKTYGTPVLIYRLNYAIDMYYGVLLEIANAVNNGTPIDLRTGYVNVIWQKDANEIALRCIKKCSSPPAVYNVTGAETISVRWLANQFGSLLNNEPNFIHKEKPTALLSDASKAFKTFGKPTVSLEQMIKWTADWVLQERETHDKPTHFQERKGKF